jgi:two-component system response regulator HydG
LADKPRVIVVDDRREMAATLADGLADHGYDAVAIASSAAVLEMVARHERIDALVTDLRMPEVDGLELLSASKRAAPERPVIVMTAFGAIDSAIESIRRGAYHYLTKPFKLEELLLFLDRALDDSRVRREAAALKSTLRERFGFGTVHGRSAAMQRVLDIAERTAGTDVPVLLLGETGTGKSLFARAVHAASPRASRPFVAVNCAAVPEALLESELFGHVKGSFTGATADRAGLFAEASGGTLFLDEIGEMTPALQAKLLRAIESGTVRPVGASKEIAVDVRLIAATHQDLRERVRQGSFREDLLYRLEVVSIELPPLRERRDDIPDLAEHFVREARARHPHSPVERLSAEAMAWVLEHDWPGNLRELSHAIERAVVLGKSAEAGVADLPRTLRERTGPRLGMALDAEVLPIRVVQRRYAAWALEQLGGHRGRTAERLGVDAKTLAKWLGGGDPEK